MKLFSRLKDAVSTCYVIRKRHDVAMLAARKAAEEAEEKHRQELAAVRRRTRGIAVFTGVTALVVVIGYRACDFASMPPALAQPNQPETRSFQTAPVTSPRMSTRDAETATPRRKHPKDRGCHIEQIPASSKHRAYTRRSPGCK